MGDGTTPEHDPLAQTVLAQRDAADPAASVWVSANAGAGKTHVLTMRVLRLLLSGAALGRILCLTYTKAAAAEMSNRVYGELSRWAGAPPDALSRALSELLGRPPSAAETQSARTLFASAIEAEPGLAIETIHAFAQRVLERAPLESGAPPGFSVLDEAQAEAARGVCVNEVLLQGAQAPETPLGHALRRAARHATGDEFEKVLGDVLAKRPWLDFMSRSRGESGDWTAVDALYRQMLGVRPNVTDESLCLELAGVLDAGAFAALCDLLAAGGKTDREAAAKLAQALAAPSLDARVASLAAFFCVQDGEPRARLMTKSCAGQNAALCESAARAQAAFCHLQAERASLNVAEATAALLEVADAVMQRYAVLKARRAAFDFDDLVQKAANLLRLSDGGAASRSTAWVLHKLGGVDHILIDEAQDTSPIQWDIVRALTSGFFNRPSAPMRTVFGVGDEKQSIYGFQGAAPHMFGGQGRAFEDLAEPAGRVWRRVPLQTSFRTVSPVLDCVDRVFRDAAQTPGLGPDGRDVRHVAFRRGHAGLVELWPMEEPEEADPGDPWSPLDEATRQAPAARLAGKIAGTIRGWLDGGERLASANRPVTPGDILILVRRRRPFAPAMMAALEARRIPVAGADRLRLAGEIAIQDMLALGDALLLPGDDLQLAAVLKSPLVGLDDDDLFALAHGRTGTLWSALRARSEAGEPRFAEAFGRLRRWRNESARAAPFEFYSNVLGRDGGRERMLARLGTEAADPLDEFMSVALAFDGDRAPELSGFLQTFRDGGREIKRDMEQGRDAVRVMTVHGAKGLEAPIVFLPDTCGVKTPPRGSLTALAGVARQAGAPEPYAWTVKGASASEAIRSARAAEAEREAHERQRLLYVAMTRARDRLYVAGFRGERTPDALCWHNLVRQAMEPSAQAMDGDGGRILRIATPQDTPVEVRKERATGDGAASPPPEWAKRMAPKAAPRPVAVTPSSLAPYQADAGAFATPGMSRDDARLRGVLTHALLQHLPELARSDWDAAARAFLDRQGASLNETARREAADQALAILRDARLSDIFGPGSRAEIAVSALIPGSDGRAPLHVFGQIDRLVVSSGRVLIVDYKSNRDPPADAADAPEAYVLQLAAYRLAVKSIFPGRSVEAAILWTGTARLDAIPAARLDEAEARLARLDGPTAPP